MQPQFHPASSSTTVVRVSLAVSLAAFAVAAGSVAATAADDLSGSWRGGGSVSFFSGKSEKARCRATYSKAGGTSYAMSATCATSSGSVSQSTTVRKVGGNSYRGKFYNAEYDTSGTISISVSGRSQSVHISATKGSASMSLSR
ncbi:MAG: hypothetical protein ACT4N2_08815 [Hyphomicrobium sp.]